MIIYPAIDISKGKIVRLQKGDFERKTIYANNIKKQVCEFEKNGAQWVHVVDLDGALLGKNQNQKAIKEILDASNCSIQLGGGIRSLNTVEEWINLGVSRVIIGTAAIENKTIVKEAVKLFPKKISVGLDLMNDKVAVNGWTKIINDKDAEYYFKKFSDLGVESIIFTDISKDGLLKGPNIDKIKYYKNIIKVPLIASGGVSSLEDLSKLANIKVSGVIVGKAIYDKKINLNEMFSIGKKC
ncbi:MAG: 1-(5-phosphoribosyl)-5-[(5-phosphoribosylamino)methylideneamino]imidazole-4-carboxamide isomerase [Alphaproteobacteria bacterium TMED93]|nr:MAG: 1-(5-phosphoribosyl)-5-[(5-phosphoribosylamino)methylideneamino]imidazole-4-carboxamide isomerase [Alphaproteobacteria bacterium TMED93]